MGWYTREKIFCKPLIHAEQRLPVEHYKRAEKFLSLTELQEICSEDNFPFSCFPANVLYQIFYQNKEDPGSGLIAQACNPSIWKAEIMVRGQPEQKNS
jgi:hypothetical protein